jgi:hypothetical protein
MDGKILTSEGQYIAYIQANQIYDLTGKKLYTSEVRKFTNQRANSWVSSTQQPETDD